MHDCHMNEERCLEFSRQAEFKTFLWILILKRFQEEQGGYSQCKLDFVYCTLSCQIMSISYYAYAFMYIKCCMNLRTVFTTYATNYLGTK